MAITSPAGGNTTIATAVTVSGTDGDATSGIAGVKVNGSGCDVRLGHLHARRASPWRAAATRSPPLRPTSGPNGHGLDHRHETCFGLQFLQPLDQSTTAPIMNKGKYGRVIPVKVLLSLAGGTALDSSALANNGWTLQMGVNGASCSDRRRNR